MEESENNSSRDVKKKMKKKRKRTVITPEEMLTLENSFQHQHRPDRFAKMRLAKQLGKSENFIAIWFQNRRAREKKMSVSGISPEDSPGSSRGHSGEVSDNKDMPLDLTKKTLDEPANLTKEDIPIVRSPLFSRMIRMAAAAEGGILTTDCPYVGQAVTDACRGILLGDGRLYYDPAFGFEIEEFNE